METEEQLDRILGIFYGQALGDAFGLATEFMDEKTVVEYFGEDCTKIIPFPNPKKTTHSVRWRSGDWTDDTDQMLLITQSLLANGMKVDSVDFAQRLYQWMLKGFPECGDSGGMGIGMTVYNVLTHRKFLDQPSVAAREVWEKYGKNLAANGAVMRTAVLGVLDFADLDKVIQNTLEICQVTHVDPRCLASCVAITVIIAQILQGAPLSNLPLVLQNAKQHALKCLTDSPDTKQEWIQEFHDYFDAQTVDELKLSEEKAIGYTYKCFACGVLALRQLDQGKDYKLLFNEIAYKGGDADTNLAVAGAMAGAFLGFDKLDHSWISQFPFKSFLDDLVIDFCSKMGIDADKVRAKLTSI